MKVCFEGGSWGEKESMKQVYVKDKDGRALTEKKDKC